ncbi:hypothetical protein FCM35_KLT09867 [Carex littledalei]|uniref:Uncharacterized protein n=1 Tax=Carex littledalei TaxID=544730 RepID=A0A833VYJ7_9POAL|nr:hypothetical protein FCM35_KLT09867 [Carex littledalei]
MAGRVGMRQVARRFFSSGGKVLGEEEKAAENVFIKKMEQEKLEKAARKGPKAAEQPPATPTAASGDAKAGPSVHESSTEGYSTDKNRNYGVLAGTVAFAGAIGCWTHVLFFAVFCNKSSFADVGPKAAEQAPTTPTAASGDAKVGPSVHESSTEGYSTDKNRNYGVLAGTVAFAGAIGWYLLSKPKKSDEKVSD